MPTRKVVIIDNYDSFTYNLVHIVEEITQEEVTVVMNDAFDMAMLDDYTHIILSPGPGIPEEAGQLMEVINQYASKKKIFGVCLGLQAIGLVFGATLKNLPSVLHGQRTVMHQNSNEDPILEGIPIDFYAGRYHSWVIDNTSNLQNLITTAIDEEGEIMAARHKSYDVYGVQFHPESIMTDEGYSMVKNFLSL